VVTTVLALLAVSSSSVSAGSSLAGTVLFTRLDLYPNIETVGVVVSGEDLPETALLSYRLSGESDWRMGHPLMRIDDGRLVGSLFDLNPSTSYEVKVTDGITKINGSTATQPEELAFSPAAVLHVDDDALPGGDGSAGAPFQTIQEAVDLAGPGTQVLVADGTYHESVVFRASGEENSWIQVKAEGDNAILDGSEQLSGNIWTADSSATKVWFTRISGIITYLARDGKRFYKYDDLKGLKNKVGHAGVAMNEGWFFDPATLKLYIRSLDNPANHTWQVPSLNYAFDAVGLDWLWVEGFEMRYYGKSTSGCGVCTVNSSHLVVRHNRIHNMQLGVYFNWTGGADRGNDTRIEFNEIYDPPVNEWPWKAVKGSSMEGTAIVVRGHVGAIVRGNHIHNFFNGIYTGSSAALENSELAFDADIYDNHIQHISDDGLEPEGACINQRFRDNLIDTSLVGVSLAPVTQGPTWVLRSVFSNYSGRSIKWDGNSDGIVLIYHNTGWSTQTDINGMDLISPMHNAIIRNNIIQSAGYSFAETPIGSTGVDFDYNNWYTTRGASLPHFKWENVNYSTMTSLCNATGLECNGHESIPGFTDPTGGNFTLIPSSPNIDRGISIPGINDNFIGNAPDLGAFEYEVDPPPTAISSLRANSNPTNAANVNFTITFSEAVTGVDLAAPFDDFGLTVSSGITDAFIASVTPISKTAYSVSVNTGAGDGTIRLDVSDNDSIIDFRGNPLGGAGTGNGDFASGETYTIIRAITTPVTVTLKSAGSYDGWVVESGENSGVGGTIDKGSTTFNLGDNAKDRQYRVILSFNTVSLPDNAVVISAQVKIKRQGLVGTDPFTTHGTLLQQIRNGSFSGNTALQTGDFSAAASPSSVVDTFTGITYHWYGAQLNDANLPIINKAGVTQFRLFFSLDDNDDMSADYMKFFSGNSTSSNAPQLIVIYYIP